MNHAEHDESIGSMLASIATALREVSDKLDIVAARVQLDVPTFPADEDLPDHTRIRRLESWAFRASQDISRLSSRLDALDNDGESDSGRPARGTLSRREVREAAEAAERAADGFDDPRPSPGSLPPHQNRDSSRPPLERRNSPARPTTDHLGDPTALAATPIPRTAEAASAPLGQPASPDTDSFAAIGGTDSGHESPSRRPAPARLSSTGDRSGERVAAASFVNGTSTNGTNGAAKGVAGDIASTRNGTTVPAAIGTVLTAPTVETPEASAPTSTTATATALAEDRAPTSDVDTSSAASATLPGSAEVRAVVREGGANGLGARKHGPSTPVQAQSPRTTPADPLTAEISPDAVIERARPVKKPTDNPATDNGRLSAPSPEGLSTNGNGAARPAPAEPVRAADDHMFSGFTGERSTPPPNGEPVSGFDPYSPDIALHRGESNPPAEGSRPAPSAEAQPMGSTANGIHWSFTDEPVPASPTLDRNGHARNGFTSDSARRAESLFDDFTPRDRLTTGESPEPPTASGPPPRLTPPTELTTQPNQVPVDPARAAGSSQVNGVGDGTAFPSPSNADRPANTGGLPVHHGLPEQAPLTSHAALTDHDRPSSDFDPPTLGLPNGREGSTSGPEPVERPVADPIPPTATDSAGITVTGTYRAFDIERAHVDKLQAMLDELKRSAGLPPGRRDVFGPPTPDIG
ncbi:hypothetical protein ACIO14_04190 [Nocardia fluminea]|uniref:hypothetical protein n=1 Tax=Nocardia fluminea TaxID=134984 RepID=UPI0038308495